MKKKTTGQRLKQIMSDRGLKQVDILRKSQPFQSKYNIKLSKSALSQYVNDIQSPDQYRLHLLAKTLNVSEPWLMGFDVSKQRLECSDQRDTGDEILTIYKKLNTNKKNKVINYARKQLKSQNADAKKNIIPYITIDATYEFPFCGSVSAGTGEWMDDEIKDTITLNYDPPSEADFALRVNGDSMKPAFDNGQVIFVREVIDSSEVLSNQFIIADLNGEAYLKKIVFEQSGCRLVSLNKKYKDIMVGDHDAFYVRGIVVV